MHSGCRTWRLLLLLSAHRASLEATRVQVQEVEQEEWEARWMEEEVVAAGWWSSCSSG